MWKEILHNIILLKSARSWAKAYHKLVLIYYANFWLMRKALSIEKVQSNFIIGKILILSNPFVLFTLKIIFRFFVLFLIANFILENFGSTWFKRDKQSEWSWVKTYQLSRALKSLVNQKMPWKVFLV